MDKPAMKCAPLAVSAKLSAPFLHKPRSMVQFLITLGAHDSVAKRRCSELDSLEQNTALMREHVCVRHGKSRAVIR